ncbi:MAG: alpha-L-fucosidase [Verrucomicrobiota bacterium]
MADFTSKQNLEELTDEQVQLWAKATRDDRMRWWREARFGMFVHWGLYAVLGRHEWAMNRERIPVAEYERLAAGFKPGPRPMREWAQLAVDTGMKYMVMTTKHHEGFCLWDSQQTDYNAAQLGPKRDLVAEYVETCREFGLKVGFYYSLMDWHHPDGARCAVDEDARRRFIDFTHGCVCELMSNYGNIDILWYDVPAPLKTADEWESRGLNAMVRRKQPHILINNRSCLDEDFGTPEGHITALERPWEACMTSNGSWGYMPYAPDEDWTSTRDVIGMLVKCASQGGGNLLHNIGPAPDGTVPPQARKYFAPVGAWLKTHGECVLGEMESIAGRLDWSNVGAWTCSGNSAYLISGRWPGGEFAVGGFKTRLDRVTLLTTGASVTFQQDDNRIRLSGMPEECPDTVAQMPVLRFDFAEPPAQKLGPCCIPLDEIE